MILISNNMQKYMTLDANVVIRINMAWVNDIAQLKDEIEQNADRNIFLDYPQGRSKFPKPTLEIEDAYELCNMYSNIKYFAVSNIETVKTILEVKSHLPEHVTFVPKIETLEGIKIFGRLVYDCGLTICMLDKEDLFTDVNKDNDEFFRCVEHMRKLCLGLGIRLLELEGVAFVTRNFYEAKS